MTKVNIQALTREMKKESNDLLKQLKVLQDDVRVSLTELRAVSAELSEKEKEKEQQKKHENATGGPERLTAYVMPDDPDSEGTASAAELPTSFTAEPEQKAAQPVKVASTAVKPAATPSAAPAKAPAQQPRQGAQPGRGQDQRPPARGQGAGARPQQGQGNRPQQGQGTRPPQGQGQQGGRPARDGAANQARPKPRVPVGTPPAAGGRPAPGRGGPVRPHEDGRNKNKKAQLKETPPSYSEDRMGSRRHKGARRNDKARMPKPEPIRIEHAVITTENVTVKELSEKLGKPAAELIKKLLLLGNMATINQELDFDTAELLASEYNITLEHNVAKTAEEVMIEAAEEMDEEDKLQSRPPVVTIMGHVDHGKTSLLDAIRETRVTAGEAGGITQHIGAYTVERDGRTITFLDTPGHEAFTAMRARGAQATDIAILVVAADDGIMPQTVEAINHAKAAEVPIIVAINKMDKPDANPDRVMQQLTEHGLVVEEWGGDIIAVPVSAKTGMNLDKLLEMILLVADVEDYKANPDRRARGIVIEAQLDKGRGPVATVLVQNGTLHVGDNLIAGTAFGRVRAMINDKGERITDVGPGYPAEVLGLNEVPSAGDLFNAVEADQIRNIADERKDKIKAEKLQAMSRVSLDNLFDQIAEGQVKELNVIVKADVQGSVEAVKQSLEKLSNEEVRVRAIHGGVGAITETDVMFASASNAIIIGFNVRPETAARDLAEREGVDLRLYRVIYNAIEDIEAAMKGMLEPQYKEVELGRAEVRDVFKVTGTGTIAGSYVLSGKIIRNAELRLVRDGIVIHEGKISSLRRFKDDVREVASGYECGIGIENYNDLKEGDILECFEMEEIER